MATFDEVQLPPNYSWGAKNGGEFSTDIFEEDSSFDDRHDVWPQERGIFDISHNVQTVEQILTLYAFFCCRFGRAYGFRFKDWNDFVATLDAVGGGPTFAGFSGLATNTTVTSIARTGNVATVVTAANHNLSVDQSVAIAGSNAAFNGTQKVLAVVNATTFQFYSYGVSLTVGSGGTVCGNAYQLGRFYDDVGGAYFRKITKPCSGLVTDEQGHTPPVPQIYVNSLLQTSGVDYVLDVTTGLVSWLTLGDSGHTASTLGPPNGAVLQWTGEFDVPVRFDSDLAQPSMNGVEANWKSVLIVGLQVN